MNKKIRFRTIELYKKEIEMLIQGMTEDIRFIDEIEQEEGKLSADNKLRRKILSEMMIKFKKAGLEWEETSDGIIEVNIDGQQIVRMKVVD
jgi:hypothetical protein